LNKLLEQLRLWHGGLHVEAEHFNGWSLGARFYPVLYMLTRMGAARDWGSGLPLKSHLLGKNSSLEVHHIFPKAQLYKQKYERPEVNALANFCFLTKKTNLEITDRLPEEYFPEVEKKHPGALSSQWIPNDPALWEADRFRDFLAARRELLAAETNRQLLDLLHGDAKWLDGGHRRSIVSPVTQAPGGFVTDDEEELIARMNAWVEGLGFSAGVVCWDHTDPDTGEQKAVFDLAWPNGIQEELSEPVAVLLNEGPEVIALASASGFRCFTDEPSFKQYVRREVLREVADAVGA
jgi:hypothetical protein